MTARKTQVWFPPVPAVSTKTGEISIFLAGTIDNGASENWQEKATELLHGKVDYIYNPRRPDWNANWAQREDNSQFNEQVTWELEHIGRATYVLFYFAPGSLAPITLLELGIAAATHPHRLIVCCPEGYWRKGNVDIVCTLYGLTRITSLDELPNSISGRISLSA